ncbi:hypothetical protein CRENBAI_016537 [Crenichthys baileyi]|uniref:Uncharacterized protein n=1 Tax=Crenichthys baileyi TaxID=28760 RepID=A0AAV9S799_9TELE
MERVAVQRPSAVEPSSSSRRKRHRCGAPSCVSAGEEKSPMAAAVMSGAMVSLPADVRAAASNPVSSSATAVSPRLTAALPMPSSLAPARCSEATPDELEQRLRFYARQIKSFRRTRLLYSSPELRMRIRQMEEDYETTPKSASSSSTRNRGRKREASAQVIGGLGDASAPAHATEGLGDASAPAHVTKGLGDASSPAHTAEGLGDASAPEHFTEGLGNVPAPGLKVFQGFIESLVLVLVPESPDEGFQDEAPPDPVPEGFKEQLVLVLASEPRDKGFEEEASPDPVSEGFKEQLVLVLASEPRDKGFEEEASPDPVSEGFKEHLELVLASEGSPDAASASKGPGSSASFSEGSPQAAATGPPGHVPEEPLGPPRFPLGGFMELQPNSRPAVSKDVSRSCGKVTGPLVSKGGTQKFRAFGM